MAQFKIQITFQDMHSYHQGTGMPGQGLAARSCHSQEQGSPQHWGEECAGRSQERLLLPSQPCQGLHIHRGFLCLWVEVHSPHRTYRLVRCAASIAPSPAHLLPEAQTAYTESAALRWCLYRSALTSKRVSFGQVILTRKPWIGIVVNLELPSKS